jgi:hypothetical protein
MAPIYGKQIDKSCYQRTRVTGRAGAMDRNGESCQQWMFTGNCEVFRLDRTASQSA